MRNPLAFETLQAFSKRLSRYARGAATVHRKTAILGALLSAVGAFAFSAVTLNTSGDRTLVLLTLIHGVLACLAAAYAANTKLTARKSNIIYVVVVGLFLVELWLNHSLLASADQPWVPLLGTKPLFLGIALVVPASYLLSMAMLVVLSVESLVVWYWFDLGRLPIAQASGEPWFTFFFIALSIGFLVFRWHHERIERELLTAQERARILSSVASLFLRVRDLANTPMQNLVLDLELLGARQGGHEAERVERMKRSLRRLDEINHQLKRYSSMVHWAGDELKVDPEVEAWLQEGNQR